MKTYCQLVGSTTYELSKYLRDILSPLAGNSDYNIKNSYVWVEKALEFQLREDEELSVV